jgi:hypothetical protein
MSDDAERRGRLNGIKLRALVGEHLGVDGLPDPESFAPGAALVHDGVAWLLVDDQPGRRLGAAMVWATRRSNDLERVELIAESGTGVLARRVPRFDLDVRVWHAEGRTLLPAVPEPVTASAPPPEHHDDFRDLIVAGGASPVVEHGVLAGEVRGLEVCRVVDDEALGTTRLEVGVGAHDREAFQMLHGDVPASESLARVVDVVSSHRRVGAQQHPLNRLAAERFLRWRLVDDPAIVAMETLVEAPPPLARQNLKDPTPCVAVGVDPDGVPTVVVCSSGVDLDLVPFAADACAALDDAAGTTHRLLIVVPPRDVVPFTEELTARLIGSAELVGVD